MKNNDIVMEIGTEILAFDIEDYNQLVIDDYYTFFKIIMKLKEFEGEKFDEYYQTKFKGNLYLYGTKQVKKNLLVVDLNDFTKIISNLTFSKESILKKYYYEKFNQNIDELEFEKLSDQVAEVFECNQNMNFNYKYPSKEKVFDLFLQPYFKENGYLENSEKLVELIINYLNQNESMQAIIIIDSSIKAFDFTDLVNDERIIIIDTSIDINNKTRNILFVNEGEIENINMDNLINKTELNWPLSITKTEIELILKLYFRIIINDEINMFNKPSNTLLCLYIVLRRILGLELKKFNFNYVQTNEPISIFIEKNMLK